MFERRKEGGIANEKKAKETDPGQDSNIEGDAKRRWKLAKNMLLAFKLENEDNIGQEGRETSFRGELGRLSFLGQLYQDKVRNQCFDILFDFSIF